MSCKNLCRASFLFKKLLKENRLFSPSLSNPFCTRAGAGFSSAKYFLQGC